jgi:membrane protease YdiL (CAAX protease family)
MGMPLVSLGVLIVAVLFGSLVVWTIILDRLARGQELVRFEPRLPVPWTGPDLVVVAILFMLAYSLAPLVASFESRRVQPANESRQQQRIASGRLDEAQDEQSPPPVDKAGPPRKLTPLAALVQLAASAAACLLAIGGLRLFAGATWQDLGLAGGSLARDAVLGLAGLLAAAPPVYGIQAVMVQFFPSEHPLIELLSEQPNITNLMVSIGLAVLVAPFIEEFVFRVLLQGWLETKEEQWARLYPAVFGRIPRGAIAVTTSALAFALLHSSQGPDPVALFPLALVFGYLYRQTHRLLPSALMHLAFNGLSLAMLWIALMSGAKP